MKLIRDEILQYTRMMGSLFFGRYGIPSGKWFDEDYVYGRLGKSEEIVHHYRDAIDAMVTLYVAKKSRSFLFSTKEVMGFPLDKPLSPGHYITPFPEMIIQFTEAIPESKLGLVGATAYTKKEGDAVKGIIIGWPPKDGGGAFYGSGDMISITAYYSSTSFNRSLLYVGGNGEVDYERAVGGYVPGGKEDKQIITNLALWCIAYLNSPGIIVERVPAPPGNINQKRARKGKSALQEYYILKIRDSRIVYPPNTLPIRVGGKHSYQYDVRSHPRKLPTGKVIIIPAHKRGVDNKEYRTKIYATGKALDGNE